MNNPRAEITYYETWLGLVKSVFIYVKTERVEILPNQTTGDRTVIGRSTLVPRYGLFFTLGDLSPDHINSALHDQLHSSHSWLRNDLASLILRAPTTPGFCLAINVNITHEIVQVISDPTLFKNEALLRMVLLGKIGREELKNLKMETEPCSICLENLSCSKHGGVATRMNCPHVFHDCCLVEWLQRKNTCPLCRTVLHDL